ncbi:hypothetical protein [Streptomyces sp. NBC_00724]|uniref:hypothetical protein n=1 Tax=Streptomyces sp. NBC_00724 TaxID=2975812 RepID=UPI002ED1B31B|nr:hypothetical protein OHB17_40900 [Streptomyces sp. NBC_00724]
MAGDPFSVSRKTWWRIGVPLAAAALLVAQLAWGNGPRREAAAVSRPGECGKGAARQVGEPGVSHDMVIGSYGSDNLPRMKGRPTFKVHLTVSPAPDRSSLTLRTPLAGAVTVQVHAGRGGGLLAGARSLTARIDEQMYDASQAPHATGTVRVTEDDFLRLVVELPDGAICPGVTMADLISMDSGGNDAADLTVVTVVLVDRASGLRLEAQSGVV